MFFAFLERMGIISLNDFSNKTRHAFNRKQVLREFSKLLSPLYPSDKQGNTEQ